MKPTMRSGDPSVTGYRECGAPRTSRWASPMGISAGRKSTSVRGTITSRSERSPASNTSSTMRRSSLPSVDEPTTMARISSSVTASRDSFGSPPRIRTRASVETPRNQMIGRVSVAMPETSGASASAKDSARCIASRLAVSSPTTIEK